MIARTKNGHAKAVRTGSPCAKKQARHCPADIDKPRFYGQSPMRKKQPFIRYCPRARPEQFIVYIARIALWRLREQTFATEPQAQLVCAVTRCRARALNFEKLSRW